MTGANMFNCRNTAKRGGRLSMMLLLNSEPSRVDDRLEETVEFLIKEEETISQELKLNCG